MREPYLQDPDVTLYHGDVVETLRELPDESVHMCCTSPPFYGLRDYGTGTWEGGDEGCDHVSRRTGGGKEHSTLSDEGPATWADGRKSLQFSDVCGKCGARRVDQQIGLEETPDAYIARLVEVFREVRRVLRDDGSLWVEIGDSYAGSWGAQSRLSEGGQSVEDRNPSADRPLSESLSAAQIKAHPKGTRTGSIPAGAPYKPKDMIGAPWLLALALRADGWYLRSEIIWAKPNPMPESVTDRPTTSHSRVFLLAKQKDYYYDADAVREPHQPDGRAVTQVVGGNGSFQHRDGERWPGSGRNRRSVWTIPTEPYPEAHFATWPTRLVEPMILAGCPEGGTVLDCFGGSGTTAAVARKHGRRTILIELSSDYCRLAADRLAQQSLLA